MATFTPPTEETVPPAFPPNSPEWNANPLGNRLMSHYGNGTRGRNVFIVDGVATENEPAATYNADGSLDQTAAERITRVFFGGHGPQSVTAAERTILEAAGYTVDG